MATAYKHAEILPTRNSNGTVISCRVKYEVRGAASEEEAYNAVRDVCPAKTGAAYLKEIAPKTYYGDGLWDYEVTYDQDTGSSGSASEDEEKVDDNKSEYTFSAGGGTKHINLALADVWSSLGAEDMKCMINFDGEKPQGIDIATGNLMETYTKKRRLGWWNLKRKRDIAISVGRMNDSNFKGWGRGEALLSRVSLSGNFDVDMNGDPIGDPNEIITMSYDFAIAVDKFEDEKSTTINGITVPRGKKLGWDCIWAYFGKKLSYVGNKPDPQGVYVQRVYNFANFNILDI